MEGSSSHKNAPLWRAVAPFCGKSSDGQLCFLEGDVIAVTLMDPSGWWEGIFQGKKGRFPCTCIAPIGPAMYDYQAKKEGELSFRRGDVIYLRSKPSTLVWSGKLGNGAQGLFPANVVYEPPRRQLPQSDPGPRAPPMQTPSPSFFPTSFPQPQQQPLQQPHSQPSFVPAPMPLQPQYFVTPTTPLQPIPTTTLMQQPTHSQSLYPSLPPMQEQPSISMSPFWTPVQQPLPQPQPQQPHPKPPPSSSSSNNVCCICLEGPKDAICIPCGHIAICLKCSQVLTKGKKPCPICRTNIERVCKAFVV